jgi:DNA ligase (NAD+)
MKSPDSSILKKVEKLRRELADHDYRYYVLAEPTITDEAYDQLMRELVSLETEYPQYITPDSPTQRVGGEPTKVFPTVEHTIPMLSLANTYSESEVLDFDRRVRDLLGSESFQYVCELKFDGISLSLQYASGILRTGATRGDGVSGDDITQNVKTIRSIPLKLKSEEKGFQNCEIRGEAILFRRDFEKLNADRELMDEKLFINPRNCTAGTLKLQDSKIVASRPLRFFAYALYTPGKRLVSHHDNLRMLGSMGFAVDRHARKFTTIEDVLRHWKEWESKRDTLPFDIDGIVVKIDSLEQQETLGAIAKSPRWAIACKFTSRKAETILKNVVLQVGRIGTITPVADLEPVFIGGTTVSRASLYNDDYIRELDIRIGDTVVVERGGDVIPKVTSVVKEKRIPGTKKFVFPTRCHECGSRLVRLQGEVNYYCDNESCPEQIRGRIEHWASRSAMDIGGLGEMIVDRLVKEHFLRNIADIYDLKDHRDELVRLERWGEKSVANLLANIEKSKVQPYRRSLYGLGIRHVGSGVAAVLVENFPSVDELMKTANEDLEAVGEIGPRIAESIVHFFKERSNKELINRLERAGIRFTSKQKKSGGILQGKTFVITGTLSSFARDEAKELLETLGAKVTSGISKNVDILIVGDNPGSKLEKGRELNLELWDEKKFLSFIKKKTD